MLPDTRVFLRMRTLSSAREPRTGPPADAKPPRVAGEKRERSPRRSRNTPPAATRKRAAGPGASRLARPDQLRGMFESFRRYSLARKHPPDFARTRVASQFLNLRHSAAFHFALLDMVMMICEAGHLGQVCDAEHLAGSGKLLESPANRFGNSSTDSAVDFVEYQRPRYGRLACAPTDGRFQRQRDSRQFAARSHPIQRSWLFTRVG